VSEGSIRFLVFVRSLRRGQGRRRRVVFCPPGGLAADLQGREIGKGRGKGARCHCGAGLGAAALSQYSTINSGDTTLKGINSLLKFCAHVMSRMGERNGLGRARQVVVQTPQPQRIRTLHSADVRRPTVYSYALRTRKSAGFMMRKLSETESQ
jgi:hypothetical protein